MLTKMHIDFDEYESLRGENERLRTRIGEIEEIAADAVKSARQHRDVRDIAMRELSRAHAAIDWIAKVRQVALAEPVSQGPGTLAVAHALSEVWLSGESVTARAVADLLGWYGRYGEEVALDWLAPLRLLHPPLVLEDLRPSIEVDGC